MNNFARAVSLALATSQRNISFESEFGAFLVASMEAQSLFDDIVTMETLSVGLNSVLDSLESQPTPSVESYAAAHSQVASMLQLAGLESPQVYMTSMEDASTGWERFKQFLLKLWESIVAMYHKAMEFIRTLLKKSSIAEKAAIVKIDQLKKQVNNRARHGLTVKQELTCLAKQSPLFDPDNQFSGAVEAMSAIGQYQRNRDALQLRYTKVLDEALNKVDSVSSFKGMTPEEQKDAVKKAVDIAADAVVKVNPTMVKKILGTDQNGRLPLFYDRQIAVLGPDLSEFKGKSGEEVMDMLSRISVQVVQSDVAELTDANMPKVRALRPDELKRLLDAATTLIDINHSADVNRSWERLEERLLKLQKNAQAAVEFVKTVDPATVIPGYREALVDLVRFSTYGLRWASAPYQQLTTLNMQLVNAVLSLVEQHLANYEVDPSESDARRKADADAAAAAAEAAKKKKAK